jgi:hypothetical protein
MFAGNHQILGTGKVDDLEVLTRAGSYDVRFVIRIKKSLTLLQSSFLKPALKPAAQTL